jgi:hypothetical protein
VVATSFTSAAKLPIGMADVVPGTLANRAKAAAQINDSLEMDIVILPRKRVSKVSP